jgi:polysaccharide chain length determinant protein (PEP-CTERM system associated)
MHHELNQDERAPLAELVPVMVRDGRRRILTIAALFCIVGVAALVLGLSWPKKYFAATTILVSEDNIIQQLMEGRAVPTSVSDRAVIAREVIFSRKVMNEVLELGGWLDDNPSPAERARRAEAIESRTLIGAPRENLIRIQYWDTDADRAYQVTQRFADRFMSESREAKLTEGREAHEFISEQVKHYHAKLITAEQNLKAFRDTHNDARPGSATDVSARIGELRRQIESARMELLDYQSRDASLAQQVGQESATLGTVTRAGQFRTRLAELQGELDRLLLDYTDSHPDVVRTRHQIADLRAALDGSGSLPQRSSREDEDLVLANPLHLELRTRQAEARRYIAGLQARISSTEALLQQELERSHRVADFESDLAELTRDYEVNRDIHQDLLRRREHAQLSMTLDEEGRGLTFRIHEPAVVPARPSGVRFVHFAVGGLVAAAGLPLGLLFLLVRFDPRIRTPNDLERQTGLPVVVSVPTYRNESDRRGWINQVGAAAALVALTLAAYAAAGWIRLVQGS